jgi:hypothetical protein
MLSASNQLLHVQCSAPSCTMGILLLLLPILCSPEEGCHAHALEALSALRVLPLTIWATTASTAGATALRPRLDLSNLCC